MKENSVIWNGNNLREVIDLIGLHPSANKWSWEEYEAVVREKGLKVFTEDGSHMVAIGSRIIRSIGGGITVHSGEEKR